MGDGLHDGVAAMALGVLDEGGLDGGGGQPGEGRGADGGFSGPVGAVAGGAGEGTVGIAVQGDLLAERGRGEGRHGAQAEKQCKGSDHGLVVGP